MSVPLLKSIGAKLFVLMVACMVMTMGAVSFQNNRTFRAYLDLQVADGLVTQAKESANAVDALVETWVGQTAIALHTLSSEPQPRWRAIADGFIRSNREFVLLEVRRAAAKGNGAAALSAETPYAEDETRFEGQNVAEVMARVRSATARWTGALSKAAGTPGAPKTNLIGLAPDIRLPLVAVAVPFHDADGELYWAILTAWQTRLAAALPSGRGTESFLIDDRGGVVASPLASYALRTQPLPGDPVVRAALAKAAPFQFRRFKTEARPLVLGAYVRLEGLHLSAVVEKDGNDIYRVTDAIVQRTASWFWVFLLVAILLCYVVASSMTRNIRAIANATRDVAKGNFRSRVKLGTKDEIGWLGTVVNRMADEIERLLHETVEKTRMAGELATAQMVQHTFLPSRGLELKGLRVYGESRTASECGGDWWGHLSLGDGLELFCIADATGHGVSAALVTAMVYTCTSSFAASASGRDASTACRELLERLNAVLFRAGQGNLTLTFLATLIDTNTGELRTFNCGHTYPLVVPGRAGNAKVRSVHGGGMILGFDPVLDVKERRHQLTVGDRVILYTDGLFECVSPGDEQWSSLKMRKALKQLARESSDQIKDGLLRAMEAHCAGRPLVDDATLVVVEFEGAVRNAAA